MTSWHFIGAGLLLLLISVAGVLSGHNIKSAEAFSGGNRQAGTGVVAGTVAGTLVGGASTIGTAQLAITYGFSAWWFTLGGGIGCLIMALFYARSFYKSHAITMPQILFEEFGPKVAFTAAIMTSIGSFLSIVSQILSGTALVSSICSISITEAVLLVTALMVLYVVWGGVWGVGVVGIIKTVILWVGIGVCGLIAVSAGGGLAGFFAALPKERYFNLFARGFPTDLGAGLSLIVGIITTQTYIQAILSAKSLRIAKRGALISSALIPVIGIAGIYIGMYMKISYPDIPAASALPLFILEKTPPLIAGILLAILLVALVGTGAGLCLGISSIVCKDIYKKYIRPAANDKEQLRFSRGIIILVLLIASGMSIGNIGSLILSWSFLSMGLRGAAVFFPLNAALFYKGKIPANFVFIAMIAGPIASICVKSLIHSIDPLFPGMAVSFCTLLAGWFFENNTKERNHGY